MNGQITTTMLQDMVLPAGLISVVFALLLARNVLGQDRGTRAMQDVAGTIFEGAVAFIRRQYTTIAVMAIAGSIGIGALISAFETQAVAETSVYGIDLGIRTGLGGVAWLCRSRLIATTNCGEQESAHRCSVQDPASIQLHDRLPQGPDNSGTRFFGYCIAGDMTVRLPHPHGPSQGWPDAFIANPIGEYTNECGARINPAGPQWPAGSGPSEVLWTVWNSDA